MAISSVGAGAGVLTQDVIDQLREADEAQYITPIKLSIANEEDRKKALAGLDAHMTNLIDSISALKDPTLFSERSTTVVGTSVEASAVINSDIQDFSLNVTAIATKQIEQSGSFTAKTETIANGAGSMNLNIGGEDFAIAYDATTTLDDLKSLINDVAGEKASATIVQVSTGDFRLFLNSVETGSTSDITLTDSSAQLKDTRLTTGLTVAQAGTDAAFTYNGQAITRTSNKVDDLITGVTIELKELGTSSVSIAQDNENILKKVDSFVSKYNETMTEINSLTKSSLDSETRGIFSSDSTVRALKSTIANLITSTNSGSMFDYGFELDKAGKLSVDKVVFEGHLENDNKNIQAFLAGGTFTNEDGSTTELTGAFTDFAGTVEVYTKFDAVLDQMKKLITDDTATFKDREATMTERLDSKYEVMKKRFIAFDILMSRINSASSVFTQLVAAQNNSDN